MEDFWQNYPGPGIITAVSEIGFRGQRHKVGSGGVGPLTQKLYDELVGIQYGRKPDPFGWVVQVWPKAK